MVFLPDGVGIENVDLLIQTNLFTVKLESPDVHQTSFSAFLFLIDLVNNVYEQNIYPYRADVSDELSELLIASFLVADDVILLILSN